MEARKEIVEEVSLTTSEEEKAMCSKVQCKSCGKPTWQGCGEHIEEALQGVAPEDRCQCK